MAVTREAVARGRPSPWVPDILVSALAATLVLWLWRGIPLYDDGAIVLRYLDNFAAGHFYAYNHGDGPVFGVSGFLHGVLAGGLAWSGLLGPLASLLASNWLGLALTSLFTLRILDRCGGPGPMRWVAWLVAATASPSLLISARQGLETPLHLAVILLAIWLLLRPYDRRLWLALALAVISKQDAVPVAAVLGALALARARSLEAPVPWRRLGRDALLLGALPLVAWVAFATVVFGSPMSRAALVKLRYHQHPHGFLPFLQPRLPLLPALLLALALTAALIRRRRRRGQTRALLAELGPGAAGLALVVLYLAYNPGERMVWYYALPEYLLLLQGILAARLLVSGAARLPGRRSRLLAGAALLAVGAVSWPVAGRELAHDVGYLRICERERIAVGRLVASLAAPGDTLAVGLGHVAREAGLYTWDLSGLNSPLVTLPPAERPRGLRQLPQQWRVGRLEDVAGQGRLSLRLVATAYDASAVYRLPALRVMRRVPPDSLLPARPVPPDAIRSDGGWERVRGSELLRVRGRRIGVRGLQAMGRPASLLAGLCCGERRQTVTVEVRDGRKLTLAGREIVVPAADAAGGTLAVALELPLPEDADEVTISAPAGLDLLEPVLMLRDVRPPFTGVSFGKGWLPAEFWGRWAVASRAALTVRVPEGRAALRLRVAPWPGLPDGQEVRVLAGDEPLGTLTVAGDPWVWQQVTLELPPGPARRLPVTLEFAALGFGAPRDTLHRALPFQDIAVVPAQPGRDRPPDGD